MSVKLFYDPHRVQQLSQQGTTHRMSKGPEAQAQVALSAVEECARLRLQVAQLRRDNQRLLEENARLRAQPAQPAPQPQRSRAIELSQPWRGTPRSGAPQADDVAHRFFGLLDK